MKAVGTETATEGRFQPLEPGLWGILATPFRDPDLAVDVDSLRKLVGFYRLVGARGVVALGVLGEAARLDSAERDLVLRTVVEAAHGMPVVVGMSAMATAPAVEEARRSVAAGARACMVLVSTNDPGQLAAHLGQIGRRAGCGIVIQDHPMNTGVVISPERLAVAATASDVAVAIKAEAAPTAPAVAALTSEADIPVFGGLGGVSLLDELTAGSAGAMTGFAFPEALIATLDAWHDGGFDAARAAYLPWLPLAVFEAQNKVSLAIRKEILRRRGLIADASIRPPGLNLPASLVPLLDKHCESVAEFAVAVRA
ncbi:MAG: dihydrodipicolinate synthase family protein [Chloroflexota bacterium]